MLASSDTTPPLPLAPPPLQPITSSPPLLVCASRHVSAAGILLVAYALLLHVYDINVSAV